jgi:hypothetical protein
MNHNGLNPCDRTLQSVYVSVFVITGQGKTPQKPVKANLKEKHFPFHSCFLMFSLYLAFLLSFLLPIPFYFLSIFDERSGRLGSTG